MALPFLPVHEVETSFFTLRAPCDREAKKKLRDIFLYFDDYWLNTVPVEMWNVYASNHRTNNICEGMHSLFRMTVDKKSQYLAFHSRLNRRTERAHANIWSFIRCLISEESRFQHLHAQMTTGAQSQRAARSTNNLQRRIDTLMVRYGNNAIDVEQLLDSLSLLIGRKK